MIAENAYLIPDSLKESYAEDNKYVMVVTNIEGEMADDSDEILKHINKLKHNMLKKIKGIKFNLKQIHDGQ